jgi:hypothetical protein
VKRFELEGGADGHILGLKHVFQFGAQSRLQKDVVGQSIRKKVVSLWSGDGGSTTETLALPYAIFINNG